MLQPPFAFPSIRQDTNANTWPAETLGRAPYKPLLLLAVLDLMEAGSQPTPVSTLHMYDSAKITGLTEYYRSKRLTVHYS